MYKSIGRGRFQVTFQTRNWSLPLSIEPGVGAHLLRILCFEFLYWRGEMRYERLYD